MSYQKVEISLTCDQASRLLQYWLSHPATCHNLKQLSGGICSNVYHLEFNRPPYQAVVKLLDIPSGDALHKERTRLDYLRKHTKVPCPLPFYMDISGDTVPYAFLFLQLMPGECLYLADVDPDSRIVIERELADVLLEMHSHKRTAFADFNEHPGVTNWVDRFLPKLIESRFDMQPILPKATLDSLDDALEHAPHALSDYGPPCLIHYDLWAGNIMVDKRDDGWHLNSIIDPISLQYADIEKELSYLEAFDAVGNAFFEAYTQHTQLRPGYHYRKLFYMLQTYMVETWLGRVDEFADRIAEVSQQITDYKQ